MKSSLSIFGTRYRIKYVDTVEVEDGQPYRFGQTDTIKKIIEVATKDYDGRDLTSDEIEVSFFHELMHAVFFEGQYLSQNEDEPLVEWCAKCFRSLRKQGVI